MRQIHARTHNQLFTCNLMEQPEFEEQRSSISDPLDPEDVTLIWSEGSFFNPSLADKRLKTLDLVSKKPEKLLFYTQLYSFIELIFLLLCINTA